jgi:hypothetical protein
MKRARLDAADRRSGGGAAFSFSDRRRVAGYVEDVREQVAAELGAPRRILVPATSSLDNEVVSAERSRAALQLGRDTSLHLGANARLRIDRFIVEAGGSLPWRPGRLEYMQSSA